IPGAADAIGAFLEAGWRVVYATNNATRTGDELVESLSRRAGIETSVDSMVSSAMAIASMVTAGPVFVLGESGLRVTINDAGFEITSDPSAAATVAVGLDRELSYDKLAAATTALLNGAAFIAANADPSFPTPSGLKPGGGSIAALLATASGVVPTFAGKPEAPIRDLILARVPVDGPIWMVGDRPDTDIAMAIGAGWNSALVLTGVVTDATEVPEAHAPDVVIDSIADLPGVVGL
ncbi:MAG: HAD-IIA family hydrolase, partial [Acidimicrobiia bacterium]|nr:HAD-IIA family hydrolase [Acidimicrobiia bacterium]